MTDNFGQNKMETEQIPFFREIKDESRVKAKTHHFPIIIWWKGDLNYPSTLFKIEVLGHYGAHWKLWLIHV